MSETADRTLAQRLEALEGEVENQRLKLSYLENLQRGTSDSRPTKENVAPENSKAFGTEIREGSWDGVRSNEPGAGEEIEDGRRVFGLPEALIGLRSWEWWLNKVGVGLLLFGVAFLFKFSVDQGWLLPGVRVGIGLSIGTVLIGIGLRVYVGRRTFSQALLGGGIGAFYITGFAAFQLYGLISYPVAVTFMVAVTLLAFGLSLRQNTVALALIAGLGGFGTPFVLYTESGSLGGLVLYTCLILAGICAIYLHKGWRSLLLFSSLSVWTIFFVGYDNYINLAEPGEAQGHGALTLGVLFAWISLSGVAVAREILRLKYPDKWDFPEPGSVTRHLFASDEGLFRSGAAAHLLTIVGPLLALGLTSEIWGMRAESVGFLAMGGAMLYALVAIFLRRMVDGRRLSYTHALVALALSTLSLVLLLEGNALFFALTAEAALLHLFSRRYSDAVVGSAAHILFVFVGAWLLERVVFGTLDTLDSGFIAGEAIFLDVGAWIDFAAIAVAFGISMFAASVTAARMYGISAHVALLGVIWRELAAFPESGAYISLAWGAYAVMLLVVGLRLGRPGFMRLGLATLFVVVGKLFLLDLAWVGAVWRILLFLGFGGLFLLLSYYLQSLWRPGKEKSRTSPAAL